MCKQAAHIRTVYYSGLCYLISQVSKGSSYSRILLGLWGQSLLGYIPSTTNGSIKDAKNALSLHRKGFSFFRNKYEFLFDAFYLAETLSNQYLNDLFDLLNNCICGLFTKGALKEVHNFFISNTECQRIPEVLIRHRLRNLLHLENGVKRVLLCGNIASGKSSIINALIGKRFLTTSNVPSDFKSLAIYNSLEEGNVIVNRGQQYFFVPIEESKNIDPYYYPNIGLRYSSGLANSPISLIDSKGFNFDAADDVNSSGHVIEMGQYNLLIYVSNCQYFGTTDEYDILSFIHSKSRKPILFVLNKLDNFKAKEDSVAKMIGDFRRNLIDIGFKNPFIIPISAQAALNLRLDNLDEDDSDDRERFIGKFSTRYYDLPQYVSNKASESALERTGIELLEKTIKEKLLI